MLSTISLRHTLALFFCVIPLANVVGDLKADPLETLPEVDVKHVRRVFWDGDHNAFTDLIQFQKKFYLTFRSCPDGHMVHPTSSIIVLASDDAQTWEPVHEFSVPLRDTRDPHFLLFKDRLFVYTGTWYSGKTTLPYSEYDLNQHLGYAAATRDGQHWESPIMLEGTFGHYIWRANQHDGTAYLCGRRKIDFAVTPHGEPREVESVMLESDDGIVWRKRAFFQQIDGDETAFLFEPNGDLLAVSRRGRGPAELCRSQPPYESWTRKDLGLYIGGPLLKRWGKHYLVGGRKMQTGEEPRTSLYWLVDDALHEFATLPSAGDNSYPGFIALDDRRAIVSWYSSHEKDEQGQSMTAIYMADLEIHP